MKFDFRRDYSFLGVLPIIGILIFAIVGKIRFNNEVSLIKGKSFSGRIYEVRESSRANYWIGIYDQSLQDSLKYLFPKGWFFEENNISIGDSAYKTQNSDTIYFYKESRPGFKFCCGYQLGM